MRYVDYDFLGKSCVIDYVSVLLVMLIKALQLTAGSTTVMHLVMREQLPEPNSQGRIAISFKFALHIM